MLFPKSFRAEKVAKTPKKRRRINPVSAKQRARNQALVQTKVELIAERGPICEAAAIYRAWLVKAPCDIFAIDALQHCQGTPDHLHHVVKRSRQSIDRKADLMLICTPCHALTEHEVELATSLGLLRSANAEAVA